MDRRKFISTSGKSILFLNLFSHFLPYFSETEMDFLMGKSSTSEFTRIKNHFVEKETASQFKLMQESAKKDGVKIQLVSAFRSFTRQKEIFESKFKQYQNSSLSQLQIIEQITQYSSIPGTSRHHWGTDLDLIQAGKSIPTEKDVLHAAHFEENAIFSEFHNWMQENAASFGFYLSYTNDENRSGYNYEPWHYSYLPKAKPFLKRFVQFNMAEKIHAESIAGLTNLDLHFFEKYITEYVLGVNSVLK